MAKGKKKNIRSFKGADSLLREIVAILEQTDDLTIMEVANQVIAGKPFTMRTDRNGDTWFEQEED